MWHIFLLGDNAKVCLCFTIQSKFSFWRDFKENGHQDDRHWRASRRKLTHIAVPTVFCLCRKLEMCTCGSKVLVVMTIFQENICRPARASAEILIVGLELLRAWFSVKMIHSNNLLCQSHDIKRTKVWNGEDWAIIKLQHRCCQSEYNVRHNLSGQRITGEVTTNNSY